jgi:hypothetical protein
MASFLGAGTGSSMPDGGGALCVLARNVSISVATTAAQAIFTAGQRCMPLYFVLRAGATALSSTTSFKVGVTGALTSLVNTTVATSLPTGASNAMMCPVVGAAAAATTAVSVAAGASVYFSAVQVDPTATTSACDLIGYVF